MLDRPTDPRVREKSTLLSVVPLFYFVILLLVEDLKEECLSLYGYDPFVSSKSTIVAPFEYLFEPYIDFFYSFPDLFRLDFRCEPDFDIDFVRAQKDAPLPPPAKPLLELLSKSPDADATLDEKAKLSSALGLTLLLALVLLRLNEDLPETPLLLNFD